MKQEFYTNIPTWDNGSWTTTTFQTRDEFKDFISSLFKIPGEYNFNETSKIFNEEGIKFRTQGYYSKAPFRSKDFISYWDDQKAKCRKGIIVKDSVNTWFLPREYYMWLNFLPIYDKEQKLFKFPDIRDAQYHMALYELLAELHYKHASVLKKRQFGSSYYHMAKLLNQLWFEEGAILKIGASLKDYINEKGSWKFLEEYSAFLNEKTAWYRPMNPNKVMMWQQKIEVRKNDRKTEVGLKSVIQGMSFEKDPTNGVGGPVQYFFHEEAGIAPKMDKTYEYIRPALRSGFVTTGVFIAAGTVGDLDQCEPLKEFTFNPDRNDIFSVETDLLDGKGTIGRSGLFIPEQWAMPPFIDEYGNSKVKEALEALDEQFETWKKDLSPEQYQLRISQHPRNIKEAFDHRTVSVFPTHLISAQEKRIEEKTYPYEFIDLQRNDTGHVIAKETTKLPILEFPVDKKREDKTGSIVVWERPVPDPEFGMYYASIDPVSEGKAEHIDNLIYTPNGKKRIGNIKIGDRVIGSSGEPINVTGVFPQGIKKLCRVNFNDGTSVLVCEDHLWSLSLNGGTKTNHILSTKDLLNKEKTISYKGVGRNKKKTYQVKTYYKNSQNKNKWFIPIAKPIVFDSTNKLPVKPYLLGALLGDGGFSQKGIKFSSVDQEIINRIILELPNDLVLKKVKGENCDYSISTKKGSRNSLSKNLKDLKLKGLTSIYKFIPEVYKYSTINERLSLLQGLMDTDGSATNNGAEFYSSSEQLANDVCELVRSLGGIAKIRSKKTTHKPSYIVRVILPENMNPFYLKRKVEKYSIKKRNNKYITDIRYECEAEAVCISVDSPDHLYLTEHGIVTHNTNTSDSLCSIYIMKAPVEVTKINGTETESFIEQGKIVAAWCGRFDDINKTHQRLEMMIEWYNAWTVIENNISLFIQYMISRKKQKYLVPKSQILFLKDLGANANVFQEYGWKNTGRLFKDHLLAYAIEFTKEELDTITKEDGTVVKTFYGIERIPDPMLLKEMREYVEGLNVDRLVSFAALVAFMQIQNSNRGYKKRVIMDDAAKNLQKSENLYKLSSSPFTNLGKNKLMKNAGFKKSPFRKLR